MFKSINLYRSYWEAISLLPDEDAQARLSLAIMRYAFDGVEPDETENPVVRAMFAISKPNLDKSRARAEAGSRGGSAGTGEVKAHKQTTSKTQANNKGEGDRVGDREGVDSLSLTPAPSCVSTFGAPCTLEEALKEMNRKTLVVYPREIVEEWYALREDNGWRQAGGKGTRVGKSLWRIDLFRFWNKRELERQGQRFSAVKTTQRLPVSHRGTSEAERSKINEVL